MASIRERIEREVRDWPGVEEKPHRFNGGYGTDARTVG